MPKAARQDLNLAAGLDEAFLYRWPDGAPVDRTDC
jgi:hypothetical protein